MKAISQPSVAARELRVTQAPLSTDLVNLVQHVAVSVSSIRSCGLCHAYHDAYFISRACLLGTCACVWPRGSFERERERVTMELA